MMLTGIHVMCSVCGHPVPLPSQLVLQDRPGHAAVLAVSTTGLTEHLRSHTTAGADCQGCGQPEVVCMTRLQASGPHEPCCQACADGDTHRATADA